MPAPLVAATVALLALTAAACGSTSGSSSASASSSGPSSPSSSAAGTTSSSAPAASPTAAPPSTGAAPAPSAAGGSAAPSPSATAGAASPRCLATQLGLHLGQGNPGAGNIYFPLTFTNKAAHACVLKGYPGVSLLRGDGSVIGRPATRDGGTVAAIRLAPGQSAQANLHTLNRGVKGNSCWRTPTLLMVYPPGSTDSMTLATSTPVVCGDTFDVSPVMHPQG